MKHVFKKRRLEATSIVRIFSLLFFCFISLAFVEAKEISGKVVDVNNEPLIGVSIVVQNTTNGTITDFDGNYRLNAESNSVLVLSFVP